MYTTMGGNQEGMWERGGFEGNTVNGTRVSNPWEGASNTAPFDQEFYLILNVAVGGRNSYFEDGDCYSGSAGATFCAGNKPWRNDSPRAMRDFWEARDQWYPTWGDANQRGMTVRSVKMYKLGGC
jgi:hypothetical protein